MRHYQMLAFILSHGNGLGNVPIAGYKGGCIIDASLSHSHYIEDDERVNALLLEFRSELEVCLELR